MKITTITIRFYITTASVTYFISQHCQSKRAISRVRVFWLLLLVSTQLDIDNQNKITPVN